MSDVLVTGYACIFNEPDQHGDVILPGAVLQPKDNHPVPVLWQHHPETPVGYVSNMVEDAQGLKVTVSLCAGTHLGNDVIQLIQSSALSGLSIGFHAVKATRVRGNIRRYLHQIQLKEISLVTFPAHPRARILKGVN